MDSTSIPSQAGLPIDQEHTIRGSVIENDLGCFRDLDCALRVSVDSIVIRVVYGVGRGKSCVNTASSKEGTSIQQGDSVEIFGKVTGRTTMSTCDSSQYYIRRLP
jgi:hypothetical protein